MELNSEVEDHSSMKHWFPR